MKEPILVEGRRSHMRAGFAFAASVALLVAGCNGDATRTSTAPDDIADDIYASCGDVVFDAFPADQSQFPAFGDRFDDIDLDSIAAERGTFDENEWHVAQESDDELILFGIRRDPGPPDAPEYASAMVTGDGQRWAPQGWGDCRIEASAPGWGNARFVRDPDTEPDSTSSIVPVLAWERACASGQTPKGRKVEAAVVASDDHSVSVVVLVEPVLGAASCQGNPSFPLEIDLGEPLGERTIVDASVDPPIERPWPPSQTSRQSLGMTD